MTRHGNRIAMEQDPENGMLIGPDGCHYVNERQAFHYGVLGLCGCGNPEEVYNFLRDILALCDRRKANDGGEWINTAKATQELMMARPDIASEALLHILDHYKLTEHGGSVYGSWLTSLGEQFLDAGPMIDGDMDYD